MLVQSSISERRRRRKRRRRRYRRTWCQWQAALLILTTTIIASGNIQYIRYSHIIHTGDITAIITTFSDTFEDTESDHRVVREHISVVGLVIPVLHLEEEEVVLQGEVFALFQRLDHIGHNNGCLYTYTIK